MNIITCLELIKLGMTSKGDAGSIAFGKYELNPTKYYVIKTLKIVVNVAFYSTLIYLIVR